MATKKNAKRTTRSKTQLKVTQAEVVDDEFADDVEEIQQELSDPNSPVARLRKLQWGINGDQAQALLKRMMEICLDPEASKAEATRAMLCVLEAQKIDLSVIKLMIEKKLVENMSEESQQNGNGRIPLETLNLDTASKIALLKKIREERTLKVHTG